MPSGVAVNGPKERKMPVWLDVRLATFLAVLAFVLVPLWLYIITRLMSSAYFRSRADAEQTLLDQFRKERQQHGTGI